MGPTNGVSVVIQPVLPIPSTKHVMGSLRRSVPKIRAATKQWMGWLCSQNEGWIQPNPLILQSNTR